MKLGEQFSRLLGDILCQTQLNVVCRIRTYVTKTNALTNWAISFSWREWESNPRPLVAMIFW